MLKDSELIGMITVYRQEVRPFTKGQVDLLHEFCRPGGHRHREHAAAPTNCASATSDLTVFAGTADGDFGGAQGHLQLAGRAGAGLRGDA